jgi:hypothetical protein
MTGEITRNDYWSTAFCRWLVCCPTSFIERTFLYWKKSLSVVKMETSNLFETAHIRKSMWEPWIPF